MSDESNRIEALELRAKNFESASLEIRTDIKSILRAIQGEPGNPDAPGISSQLALLSQRITEIERRALGWDHARYKLAGIVSAVVIITGIVVSYLKK